MPNWNDGTRWGQGVWNAAPSAPPLQTRKSKKRTMPQDDYLKRNDGDFAAQLDTFKLNIPGYATTLGVSPAQVTAQAADADYFGYVVACHQAMQNGAQQWSGWKKLIRAGGTPPVAGAPVPPVFPTTVPAVALGIEVRFRALVKQIKAHANYNPSIGEALGIEGVEQGAPDFATLKPEISAMVSGNRVEITWGWQGFRAFLDMCEIQVDRGAGFAVLTYDSSPTYIDTTPFPATPVKWTYKAIYRVDDAPVGQWSLEVSVIVGG